MRLLTPLLTPLGSRGFEVQFTLLRPHQGGQGEAVGAVCEEAVCVCLIFQLRHFVTRAHI